MTVIRESAVAGQFYPGNTEELGKTIEQLLADADDDKNGPPKALIVPHAGYVYSGPIAASAYAHLRPYRGQYNRVVLLGPCHRVPVNGLALSGADAFRTPLGDVPLDKEAIARIDCSAAAIFDGAHELEHSLEVHLPFLQTVIGSFKLVPIVVGHATHSQVAGILEELWGGSETLIVVSSDLSHYLGYDQARATDGETRRAIEQLDGRPIDHDAACGATPVGGLLMAAAQRGMKVTTLDLRNSGDTAGDKRHVVGYGAWVFVEQ